MYSMMMNVVARRVACGSLGFAMALVLGVAQLIAATAAGWTFTNLGYPRTLTIIAAIALTAAVLFKSVARTETAPVVRYGNESPAE